MHVHLTSVQYWFYLVLEIESISMIHSFFSYCTEPYMRSLGFFSSDTNLSIVIGIFHFSFASESGYLRFCVDNNIFP